MKNRDNIRTIHTNLYSNKAKEILNSVFGQMSDGMWENSPAMDKYWKFAETRQQADGEIVIDVSKEYGQSDGSYRHYHYTNNGFLEMPDRQVLEFLAKKVKTIMQAELKDDNVQKGWKRDNTLNTTAYLSYHETITVAEVYFLYEYLLGRVVFDTPKYTTAIVNGIVGQMRTAAEALRVEDKERRLAEFNEQALAEYEALEVEKKAAIDKIEAEYQAKRHELYERNQAKRKEIEAA